MLLKQTCDAWGRLSGCTLIMYYFHLQLGIAIKDTVLLCSLQTSNNSDCSDNEALCLAHRSPVPCLYALISSLAFPYT